MTTLREKPIKIGAKVVTHARYIAFQMAEVAISRQLFRTILRHISRLGPVSPVPTCPSRRLQGGQSLKSRWRGVPKPARTVLTVILDGRNWVMNVIKEPPGQRNSWY